MNRPIPPMLFPVANSTRRIRASSQTRIKRDAPVYALVSKPLTREWQNVLKQEAAQDKSLLHRQNDRQLCRSGSLPFNAALTLATNSKRTEAALAGGIMPFAQIVSAPGPARGPREKKQLVQVD